MRQGWILLGVLALVIFILINFSLMHQHNIEVEEAREACEDRSAGEACQLDGKKGTCVECEVGVICQKTEPTGTSVPAR